MPVEHIEETPPRRRRGLPNPRRLAVAGKLVLIAVAVVLMVRLFEGLETADLNSLLTRARRGWLVAAAGFLAARAGVWAVRWNLALRRAGFTAPWTTALLAVAGATAINHVTPGARIVGGFLRARWLSRAERAGSGGTFGGVFGTVLFDQLNHQIATGGATVLALAGGLALLGRPGAAAALLLGAVLAAGAALGVWRRRRGEGSLDVVVRFLARRAAAADGRMQRLYSHSREAVEVVRRLAAEGGLWVRCLTLGGVFVALNVLAQEAAFAAVGAPPPWTVVFIGVALGSTAGILLGTPGGVGATEAAMIACYVALGADRLDATAAVLLYRGLHYAVVLLLGLPSIAFFELRRGRKPESRG